MIGILAPCPRLNVSAVIIDSFICIDLTLNTMVAASKTATADPSGYSKFTLRNKGRNDTLRWRSTGWTPLAYPASALFVDSAGPSSSVTVANSNPTEVNPYFPLDTDVLRAAIRELLILDGSLHADTLTLKEQLIRFESSDAQITHVVAVLPFYSFHLQPGQWKLAKQEVTPLQTEKRDDATAESSAEATNDSKRKVSVCLVDSNRRLKRRYVANKEPKSDEQAESDKTDIADDAKASVSSAAALVDIIQARALERDDRGVCSVEPLENSAPKESLVSSNALDRPLRKVSDVDQGSLSDCPPGLLDVTDETCSEQDFSLFIDIVNRKENGSVALLEHEIPAFLDVSIAFESFLRNAAYRMLHQMCSSFDSEALRLFLGYKSSALKRDRVLRILSDYLFDVSHAMFAWKQTESEILSERTASSLRTQTSFCQEIDSLVRDSLFDERALKKIGGLDDSSILRHAIEFSRSERRREPWEKFAKTATGRRLFSHHRSGRAHLVGQKRRGQRIKRFSSSASADASEEGQRSRASSIASYDDDENCNRGCRPENLQQQPQQVPTHCSTIQNMSEVLDLTLTRNVDESWGVLLSREGDMCIVERALEMSTVRCGDMVLSVKNDRGESAAPPASSANNDNPGWFQDVVNVFKVSNELHLVVRRVGC